jgi:hypothetical protein
MATNLMKRVGKVKKTKEPKRTKPVKRPLPVDRMDMNMDRIDRMDEEDVQFDIRQNDEAPPLVKRARTRRYDDEEEDVFENDAPLPDWPRIKSLYRPNDLQRLHRFIAAYISFYAYSEPRTKEVLDRAITERGKNIQHPLMEAKNKTKRKREKRIFMGLLMFLKNMVPMTLIPNYLDMIIQNQKISEIFDVITKSPEYQRMKTLKTKRTPKQYIYPVIGQPTQRQPTQRQPTQRVMIMKYAPALLQIKTKQDLSTLLEENHIVHDDNWDKERMITELLKIPLNVDNNANKYRYLSDLQERCVSTYMNAPWIREYLRDLRDREGNIISVKGGVTGIALTEDVDQSLRSIYIGNGWYTANYKWYKQECDNHSRKFEEQEIGYVVKTNANKIFVVPETMEMYESMVDYFKNHTKLQQPLGLTRRYRQYTQPTLTRRPEVARPETYTLDMLRHKKTPELLSLLKTNHIVHNDKWSENEMKFALLKVPTTDNNKFRSKMKCVSTYRTAPWITRHLVRDLYIYGDVIGIALKGNNRSRSDLNVGNDWYMANSQWYEKECTENRTFEEQEIGYVVKNRNGKTIVIPETKEMYESMVDYFNVKVSQPLGLRYSDNTPLTRREVDRPEVYTPGMLHLKDKKALLSLLIKNNIVPNDNWNENQMRFELLKIPIDNKYIYKSLATGGQYGANAQQAPANDDNVVEYRPIELAPGLFNVLGEFLRIGFVNFCHDCHKPVLADKKQFTTFDNDDRLVHYCSSKCMTNAYFLPDDDDDAE